MSSPSYSPPDEEEGVCWTEKEGLWLNVVVKEENEEEDITVTKVEEEQDVTVKEEEEVTVLGVKEKGEITVTLEEEETGDRINTSKYGLKNISCCLIKGQANRVTLPLSKRSYILLLLQSGPGLAL